MCQPHCIIFYFNFYICLPIIRLIYKYFPLFIGSNFICHKHLSIPLLLSYKMWTHVFTIVPTKSYHHSNLCSTNTFSIIQCKIKETPLAMNEVSWYMYTSYSILSARCRLPTQPFRPEAVLRHLSNNRTGQIVSVC